jgi:RNA polymerase sigma-70 factor (ECF subfamily)
MAASLCDLTITPLAKHIRRNLRVPVESAEETNERLTLPHIERRGKVAEPTTERRHNFEQQLISRAIKGEESAFAELFEMHQDHVYCLCLRMTANVAEAEDLTQEAFVHIFHKLASFRNKSALSTWIHRIAVNTTLMRLRKKTLREVSLDQRMSNNEIKQELDLSRHDERLRGTVDRLALIRAISELPPGCRTVFLLHDGEGYGHQELARLLNSTVGNTRSQLHKARLRIRELLLTSKATGEARVVSEMRDRTATAKWPHRLGSMPRNGI